MKKLLLTLVVSVGLVFWGCSVLASSKSLFGMGNKKADNKSVIGLTLEEMREEFETEDIIKLREKCLVSLGSKYDVDVAGDVFIIIFAPLEENINYSKEVCVVKNIVIRETDRAVASRYMDPESIKELVLKPFTKPLKGPELEL